MSNPRLDGKWVSSSKVEAELQPEDHELAGLVTIVAVGESISCVGFLMAWDRAQINEHWIGIYIMRETFEHRIRFFTISLYD
jgi:hypothetical protein